MAAGYHPTKLALVSSSIPNIFPSKVFFALQPLHRLTLFGALGHYSLHLVCFCLGTLYIVTLVLFFLGTLSCHAAADTFGMLGTFLDRQQAHHFTLSCNFSHQICFWPAASLTTCLHHFTLTHFYPFNIGDAPRPPRCTMSTTPPVCRVPCFAPTHVLPTIFHYFWKICLHVPKTV